MTQYSNGDRVDVVDDLRLSDIEDLQKTEQLFDFITIQVFGLDPNHSRYNRAKALEGIANKLQRQEELEGKARASGYKSLATAIYGLSKQKDTSLVPAQYLIAPDHVLSNAKNPAAEQKKWDSEVLPLMNGQLDETLNDADWINLDWAIHHLSRQELQVYLLDVERRELNGEFDEELQEVKVREVLEQRLLATQERLGLLPATETKMLAAGAEKKESVEMRFVPTGATTNADKDLGAKQIASLSDEERELYEQIFG